MNRRAPRFSNFCLRYSCYVRGHCDSRGLCLLLCSVTLVGMFLVQLLPSDFNKYPLVKEIIWPLEKDIRYCWNKRTLAWDAFKDAFESGDCWEEENNG